MKITHDQFIKLLAMELGDSEKITSIRLLGVISEINRAIEGGGKYEIKGFGTFQENRNRLSFTPSESLASEVNINYAGFMPLDLEASRLSDSEDSDNSSDSTKPKTVKSGVIIVDDEVLDGTVSSESDSSATTKDTIEDDPFGIAPFDPEEVVLEEEPKPRTDLISDKKDAEEKESSLESIESIESRNQTVKSDAKADQNADIVKKDPVSAKTDSKKGIPQAPVKSDENTGKLAKKAIPAAKQNAATEKVDKNSVKKESEASPKPSVLAESSQTAANESVRPVKKVQEITKPKFKDDDLDISGTKATKSDTNEADTDKESIIFAPPGFKANKSASAKSVAKDDDVKKQSTKLEKQSSDSKKETPPDQKEILATSPDAAKASKTTQRKENDVRRKPDSSLKYVFAAVAVVLVAVFAWWYVTDQGALEPTVGELPVAGVSRAMVDQDQSSEGSRDGVSSASVGNPAETIGSQPSSPTAATQQPETSQQPAATQQSETTQQSAVQIIAPEPASITQTRAAITEDPNVYAGEQWENQRALTPILGGMFGLEGESRVIQGRVFSIIVHSVPNIDDANRARNEIVALGLRSLVVEARGPQGEQTFRVGIGQFPSIIEAERAFPFLPEPYRSRNFVARIN